MTEFWETNFIEKQEMWGLEPAKPTLLVKDFFVQNGVKNILMPGIGYCRNAQVFKENGMEVTGIEISKTAINLAKKHFGQDIRIYHGSVNDMPYDQKTYDGIFCSALIHLLNQEERVKLIQNCYNQLNKNGFMVFTAITKNAPNYGKGKLISRDRYEFHAGAQIYFYDQESVQKEFGQFGLFESIEVEDNQPMFLIKCRKEEV